MSKFIKVNDDIDELIISIDHISMIFEQTRTVVMDCVTGSGNGVTCLDEESFKRVMHEIPLGGAQ